MKLILLQAHAHDLDVVNAARVSFGKRVGEVGESDKGLIKFLLKNGHGTPFEHGYFQFHVEAPIFVLREWQRHRIGHSYNEMSGRYVELGLKFYTPRRFRKQLGKPGAYTFEEFPDLGSKRLLVEAYDSAWETYQKLLAAGVAKEQARAVLPLGIYSQMYWSCNPRSLMHFLDLRTHPQAMREIRDLAEQAAVIFSEQMPVTAAAWHEIKTT